MKHLAVVGCGRVVERYYLPALRGSTDWTLVAAVDPHPARRQWIAASLPGVAVHATLAELSPSVPVDAVLIASPPDSHARIATEALRRGAHVLLEKPMTPTIAEARALVCLAQDEKRHLWVGFNRRFRPSYGQLRERLRQVPKHSLVSICYDLRSDIEQWHAISAYLGSEELGGGVLDDIASHQLDLLPWVLDMPVTTVSASYVSAPVSVPISAPTSVSPRVLLDIRLRFPGGLEARCRAGHGGPTAERLEVTLDRGVLLATRGGLMSSSHTLPIAVVRRFAAARDAAIGIAHRLTRQPSVTVSSFRRQLADWAQAIGSGRSTIAADGAAGARCVGLVAACRESLAQGGAWVPATEV